MNNFQNNKQMKKFVRNSSVEKVAQLDLLGEHKTSHNIWNVIQKQEVNNCSLGKNKLYLGQRRLNKSCVPVPAHVLE